jgi:hypothetical protein
VSPTALERLALYFAPLRTRPGILGRRILGAPDPTDRGLALELAVKLTAEIRPDGTVSGGAVPTIWRGHELLDLGVPSYDPALKRICAWLFERQGRPGAYGAGCDKARHQQRVCEHYVQGFFSPGGPEERLAPITLPNGKVFRAEPAARFAISCLGLRLVLRVGHGDRPGVIHHLDSLRLLAAQWTSWTGFFAPDVIVAGLHALAAGGRMYRGTVETLVDLVAAYQDLEGAWPHADFFATLDALLATDVPEARRVLRRATPAVEARQRGDGAFGATAQQERALIALRTLRTTEERRASG